MNDIQTWTPTSTGMSSRVATKSTTENNHEQPRRAGFAPTSGSFSEPLIRPLDATVCGTSYACMLVTT